MSSANELFDKWDAEDTRVPAFNGLSARLLSDTISPRPLLYCVQPVARETGCPRKWRGRAYS